MTDTDRRNVSDAISEHGDTRPDAVALVEGERSIDYAAFDSGIWRAARHFADSGIRRGDVVALRLPNSALFLVAFHALARLGAVVLPISISESPENQTTLVRRFSARFAVGGAVAHTIPCIRVDPAWLDGAVMAVDLTLRADGGEAPLKIAFSSGTTGRPKAVLRSHRASLEIDRHRRQAVPQSPDDVFVAILDMALSYGLRPCLRTLEVGATVVVAPVDAKPTECLELIRRHRATQLALTPIHLNAFSRMAGSDEGFLLPHVRELIVSTASSGDSLRAAIRSKVTPNLIISYGANEVNVLAVAPPDVQDAFPGAVGRPVPGIEVQAVDDKAIPVPSGTLGQLRFRAPWFPVQYIDDTEATARIFRDGWFQPGDMGVLTDGNVIHLKGRIDDVINMDGIKIAPVDLENALLAHPAVGEAAAFPIHSDVHHHVPVVAVVLKRQVAGDELMEFARRRLGKMAPANIVILRTLPRNALGKVLKREIAAAFAERIGQSGRQEPDADVK